MIIKLEMAHGDVELTGEESIAVMSAISILRQVWIDNPYDAEDVVAGGEEYAANFKRIEEIFASSTNDWEKSELLVDLSNRLVKAGWGCYSMYLTLDSGHKEAVESPGP